MLLFLKRIWIVTGIFLAFVFIIGLFSNMIEYHATTNYVHGYFVTLASWIGLFLLIAIAISITIMFICGAILLIHKVSMIKNKKDDSIE